MDLNKFKIGILILLPSLVFGCATELKKKEYLNIENLIVKEFPNMEILKEDYLDEDTRSYFRNIKGYANPGIVCFKVFTDKDQSCLLILVNKMDNMHYANQLVYIENIYTPNKYQIIEDYSSEKRKVTNIFLTAIKKSTIENRGYGDIKIQMTSDGVQRVSYGQSSMVIFVDDGKIKKIWTAD